VTKHGSSSNNHAAWFFIRLQLCLFGGSNCPLQARAVCTAHRCRDDDLMTQSSHRQTLRFVLLRLFGRPLRTPHSWQELLSTPQKHGISHRGSSGCQDFAFERQFAPKAVFFSVQDASGRTCAQVCCGTKSHMMSVLGTRSKSEMPLTCQDFMCEEGIPNFFAWRWRC
jgi:hypothetical protein